MSSETVQQIERRPPEGGVVKSTLTGPALSLGGFLEMLRQGRRTILLCGLGTLLVATVVAFLLPPTYSATTSFIPPGANAPSGAGALMSQLSALGGAGLLSGGRSQGDLFVGILKSHTIASYLVDHFHLESVYKVKKESQAEKVLAQNSLFSVDPKDSIVTITVQDRSPQGARDLANGYLQALTETSSELTLGESSQRRLFYEQRLRKEKDDLANAEVALKQVQERTGLIAPGAQTSSEIQSLAQLQAQISGRQAQLAALRYNEADTNPDVIQLRTEIGNLQAQVNQQQTGSKSTFGRLSTAQVPAVELDYIRRARDVKYHEALFEIIARQYEAARLDEARDTPLQILDHATVPDTKSGPHRSIFMMVGLLLGLVGGVVLVLFRHARALAAAASPAVSEPR